MLESRIEVRETTTTLAIRPVPNGGAELPDPPTTDDSVASPSTVAPTTTASSPVSVKSASTSRSASTKSTTSTKASGAAKATPAPAAGATPTTRAPQADSTTTTTPPSTTTTVLPANPPGVAATPSPTFAIEGDTQAFQYSLSDPQSGPAPTVPDCTGTDYMLGSSGGYVLAPFQTNLTCDTPGEILRVIPADAPLGAYQFCTTIDAGSASAVCAPYYVINFGTSIH